MRILRILFIIMCTVLGWCINKFTTFGGGPASEYIWASLGFLAALGVIIIEQAIRSLASASRPEAPGAEQKSENLPSAATKILDTSVIIDGRIADVVETGFLEGTLVIPRFVLRELQRIADSEDSLKRNRGKRGLDILNKMRQSKSAMIQIQDIDFPDTKEVDAKLVKLAKEINGKVITNDFNLNKIAQLQGVKVLNINELSNVLKPVVLPGEEMSVFVVKEGKDPNQGVAYLDDGTMVVVDNGKPYLGKTVSVVVTSVLQTQAGRMIFTKLKEGNENK